MDLWGPGARSAQKSAIFGGIEDPPRTRQARDTSETGTSHVRAPRRIRPQLFHKLMAPGQGWVCWNGAHGNRASDKAGSAAPERRHVAGLHAPIGLSRQHAGAPAASWCLTSGLCQSPCAWKGFGGLSAGLQAGASSMFCAVRGTLALRARPFAQFRCAAIFSAMVLAIGTVWLRPVSTWAVVNSSLA